MSLTPYTTVSAIAQAIAAACEPSQSAFTSVGSIDAAKREGPPRVTWIPGGGEITDPDQDESEYSKIAFQRNPVCSVTFLGGTYDQAEALYTEWLGALYRSQSITVRPGREEYGGENATNAQRHWITVEVTLQIPVPFEVYTAADVQGADPVLDTGTVTEVGA